MSGPTSLQTEAVRLALAACVGKGAEARDVVELAAEVVGEVFRLRGTMTHAEANTRQAAELAERRLSLMNQLGRTLDVSVRREDALRAEVERLTGRIDAVEQLIADNGCQCKCVHTYILHNDDCVRCFGCRVDLALRGEP